MDNEKLAALLFTGFAHGCNKIHSWGIPTRPAACSVCEQLADAQQQDATVQR